MNIVLIRSGGLRARYRSERGVIPTGFRTASQHLPPTTPETDATAKTGVVLVTERTVPSGSTNQQALVASGLTLGFDGSRGTVHQLSNAEAACLLVFDIRKNNDNHIANAREFTNAIKQLNDTGDNDEAQVWVKHRHA